MSRPAAPPPMTSPRCPIRSPSGLIATPSRSRNAGEPHVEHIHPQTGQNRMSFEPTRITRNTTLDELRQFAADLPDNAQLRAKRNGDGSYTLYAKTGKTSLLEVGAKEKQK